MKTCPKCQASVLDTAKFCVKCGFNIKKHEEETAQTECFCPECGTKFSGGTFCPECGYDISRDLAGAESGGVAATSIPTISPAFTLMHTGVDFGGMNDAAQSQLYEKEGFVVENGILTGYTGKKRIITIPGTVEEIFDEAFAGNTIVSFVEIEEGVKVIGKRAFANCDSLVKISIPSSVEKLFDSTFEGTKLETLLVATCDQSILSSFISQQAKDYLSSGGSMDAYLERQNGRCVINILALEKDAQKAAAEKERRQMLAKFDIQDGVLVNYKGRDKSVQIPDGVTVIGEAAFAGCENLTTITIPDGVTVIGDYAFSDCDSLTSITIPDGVTVIGEGAFARCSNLTTITIPEGVTTIGKGAFQYCNSVTSITIPNSVSFMDLTICYGWTENQTIHAPGRLARNICYTSARIIPY